MEKQVENMSLLSVETKQKIGLALSGGGFRAAIFHLGVIRRLEELGLMKKVSVISSVSGGSIIAAYYIIEMERRLRKKLPLIINKTKTLDEIRLGISEKITDDFFDALDKNMRCRAMVFSPFHHPVKWLMSLWPGYSRSNLMAAEYDKWLYDDNTIDQLPSVTETEINEQRVIFGPRLLLNTTSLVDGRRAVFSREPVCSLKEFGKINKNTLKLSRVVGASSCVPGVFPPLSIACNKLVDGGVSDNQGIEALIGFREKLKFQEKSEKDNLSNPAGTEKKEKEKLERYEDLDVLFVSDASGQMEQADNVKDSAISVLSRTMSILQFQIRENMVQKLIKWKEEKVQRPVPREFAFVHLYLNVKDRPKVPRVPSEYIPGLARMRTDLDQFSFIERESLMYHGYTLMDAQIKEYCEKLCENLEPVPMSCPPLFVNDTKLILEKPVSRDNNAVERRKAVKKELEAGIHKTFLLRSAGIYRKKMIPFMIVSWLIPIVLLYFFLISPYMSWLSQQIGTPILKYLISLIPQWVGFFFSKILGLYWPFNTLEVTRWITAFVTLGISGYLLCYGVYLITRRRVRKLALSQYEKLTEGQKPTASWKRLDETALNSKKTVS